MAKKKGIGTIRPKMTGCNQKILIFWCFSKDNSKQWAMRRLSQLLVLTLSSSIILLYQFLQPAIGGRGQFLKASCHSWGFDKAALKGIL
jgi:hypothetical protein